MGFDANGELGDRTTVETTPTLVNFQLADHERTSKPSAWSPDPVVGRRDGAPSSDPTAPIKSRRSRLT